MAGSDAGEIPGGWYPDPENASAVRYWNGVAWTEHRRTKTAPARGPQIGWLVRLSCLAFLPWLTFELVLLLVPVWAPDEPHSLGGVIGTAVAYAFVVATPGVVLAFLTFRKSVLVFETVVLVATAAWAAIAMVASDDAQAGLAVLIVWVVAVPLLMLAVLFECAVRSRTTSAS